MAKTMSQVPFFVFVYSKNSSFWGKTNVEPVVVNLCRFSTKKVIFVLFLDSWWQVQSDPPPWVRRILDFSEIESSWAGQNYFYFFAQLSDVNT